MEEYESKLLFVSEELILYTRGLSRQLLNLCEQLILSLVVCNQQWIGWGTTILGKGFVKFIDLRCD